MAIAGSLLKQAANIVGKAIKVTKKKKGQVGGKLKKQFKKEADFIDKKIVKPAKDRVSKLKDKAKPQFIKGMPNPKAMYAGTKAKASEIADAAVNTQVFTKGAEAIKKGTKAIKATAGKAKKATRRMANSPFGIAATASAAELNKATGGFISGKNIAAVAGVAGALGLTQSIINRPKILILDEPFVNLDNKTKYKYMKILSNKTIFLFYLRFLFSWYKVTCFRIQSSITIFFI